MYKKPSHRRDNSGELDVFEAAKYFSGQNECNNNNASFSFATFAEKSYRDDNNKQPWRIARTSLDMSVRTSSIPTHHHNSQILQKKKYKQPSSPGGKLASFLNSLFSQTSSKNKNKKSKSAQSVKDDQEESPGGWRRRRRSSMSHFRSSNAAADSKSIIYSSSSSSNSGFRTPPIYPYIPTKSYKDLRSSSSGHNELPVAVLVTKKVNGLKNEASSDDNRIRDLDWLNEKVMKSVSGKKTFENAKIWEEDQQEKIEYRTFAKVDDDGADSDSSSDLFELQNYDLCHYSSSLPVYETTNMGSIKRGTQISNGAI